MKDLERILGLLEEKKAYFLHYEKEMEALPLLPAEELEACVERGALIIKKLEELDKKLEQLLRQNGPKALAAANHECDRAQLDPASGKLYDGSLAVKAVASRILKNGDMIRQRIAFERDKAMEGIKEINMRSYTVAGKYQKSLHGAVAVPFPAMRTKEA